MLLGSCLSRNSLLDILGSMTIDLVLKALSEYHPLPGATARACMAPGYRLEPDFFNASGTWREAAVLLLLYEVDGITRFPLMLRPSGGGVHSSQISLPGGSREAGESLEDCALRETAEELGVESGTVRVVRALSPLEVPPSRFTVHPFVGMVSARPVFRPAPAEVAAVFEPSLDDVLDSGTHQEDLAEFSGSLWRVPYYRLSGQRVWGATAMILAELEAMLRGNPIR